MPTGERPVKKHNGSKIRAKWTKKLDETVCLIAEDMMTMTKHLKDGELMAFLYQDIGEEAAEHLRVCSVCQAELRSLHSMDGLLAERLYRLHCPSPETLADYVEDSLSRKIRRSTREHLLHCAACQREIHALEPLATSDAAQRGHGRLALLAEGVRRLFMAYPDLIPAALPTRGEASSLRRYHTQDMDILFSIIRSEEGKAEGRTVTLVGQLVPLGETIASPFQGVATIDDPFVDTPTVPIDELGGFLLADVTTGPRLVRIELRPDIIILMNIDV